jgi:hypothetical protein
MGGIEGFGVGQSRFRRRLVRRGVEGIGHIGTGLEVSYLMGASGRDTRQVGVSMHMKYQSINQEVTAYL